MSPLRATTRGNAVAAIVVVVVSILSSLPATAQFRQSDPKLVGTGAAGALPPAQGLSAAISASGQTVIVGGPFDGQTNDVRYGAAWVFQRDAGAWGQQGSKLVGTFSGIDIAGHPFTETLQGQGSAVAISADGNTALVGAEDSNGVAVWIRSGVTWTQQAALGGSFASASLLGHSVALSADGNTAVFGGPRVNNFGAIWIWTRSGSAWSEVGKFQRFGASGGLGPLLNGQGTSVAISGDGNTIITGSMFDYDIGQPTGKGAVFVWVRSGGTFVAQGPKLVGSSTRNQQGTSVALSYDGNTAIVGSGNDGAAWIWTRSGGVWTEQARLDGVGGSSVGLSYDGNTAMVGNLSNGSAGAGWVFTRSGGVWTQLAKLTGNDSVGDSDQGSAVGLSADAGTVMVGGFNDNGGIGAAWVYDQSPTVTTVTPNFGGVNGGTGVTIKGSGFISGNTVTFDHVSATGVTVVDPTTITAVTPARPPGAVTVEVTTVMGRASAASAYTYRSESAVALSSAQNPSTYGSAIDYTATVTGAGATGSVAFMEGATTFATLPLSGGGTAVANLLLPAGEHSLTALYSGDGSHLGSTSSPLSQIIDKATPTVTATAAPAVAKPGHAATLTAKIMPPAGVMAGGSVTFKEGNKPLSAAVPVSANKASASVSSLTIGSHVITALYHGDSNLMSASATASAKVSAAVGTESKVNVETDGAQQYPAVAKSKNGYVVVWASNGQDGSGYGIYGQRFNANAASMSAADMPISTTQTGNQTMPKVAGLTGGRFVVVWQSDAQGSNGIIGRSFSAAGVGGVEFKVTTTSGAQTQPAIAALADGGFVVAWTSDGWYGSGVYVQRYDAKAKPVGVAFKVNTTTAGNQSNPAVAGLTGGGFVVTWQGPDASGVGIYAQRYAADGSAAGKQIAVNKRTLNDQTLPSIAALVTGGFVIAWQSADASGMGVYARRYDSQAKPIDGEVLVNTTTVNDQGAPSVAAFSDGGYVVAWTSNLQDGSGQGIYAQAYTDDRVRANVEFPVNSATAGNQNQPAVAAFASGNFVVVWTSANDGSGSGVFSQRFLVPGTN